MRLVIFLSGMAFCGSAVEVGALVELPSVPYLDASVGRVSVWEHSVTAPF